MTYCSDQMKTGVIVHMLVALIQEKNKEGI